MAAVKKIALIYLIFLFLPAGEALACAEYVHVWKPIAETRHSQLSAQIIADFLRQLKLSLPENESVWKVCINPLSDMPAGFDSLVASAVLVVDDASFVWADKLSPFSDKSRNVAAIWLDFIDPLRQTYLWSDENKPPLPMFRIGEMETTVVRVMVRDNQGKIVLIKEFKLLFLLESDLMLPSWMSCGGAWFRRLSFQKGFEQKRIECTVSVPPDQETLNSTPENVIRFYCDE